MLFIISFQGISQKKHNPFEPFLIDTLYIFEPYGQILYPQKFEILEDTLVNIAFVETFKKVITETTPFVSQFFTNDFLMSDSVRLYLDETAYKITTLNKKYFQEAKVSDKFIDLLKNHNGRFYAIVFYEGFYQKNYTEKVVGSILLGIATTILTGGYATLYTTPSDPYLFSDIAIIDKDTKQILYYHFSRYGGSPTKIKIVNKNIKRMLKPYIKAYKKKDNEQQKN